MSWRTIAYRASNYMLGSWTYAGAPSDKLWNIQSSCQKTNENLEKFYSLYTKKAIK